MKSSRIREAPSTQDLTRFDYGVATAALAHLFAQEQAGALDYYRRPTEDRAWNVWLNHAIDTQTGYRGVRMTLEDFVCAFAAGTLPTQQQQLQTEGGAA